MALNDYRGRPHEVGTEVEHSLRVDRLPEGTRLVLQTASRDYLIETCGGLNILLQGHPDYCPEPAAVYVAGSRIEGSAPEPGCIRRGMRVDFWHPSRGIITTSTVQRMRILLT
jgi:hypothetical protein